MDEPITYFTINSNGEGFYKEKGSKFYAHAYPVNTEKEVKEKLEALRKKYFDARHYCYAFRLGLNNQQVRANDDGEPSHSAGDPILGQIRSNELTDVLVVVVRYFGGIKLGVGGLIHAYKTAAKDALKELERTEVFLKSFFEIKYSYEQTPKIEKFIQSFQLYDVERKYEAHCVIRASIRMEFKEQMQYEAVDNQLSINWLD
ncbi:MAG: IMPACT family protein [Cyclobacteriaceae bacterium]